MEVLNNTWLITEYGDPIRIADISGVSLQPTKPLNLEDYNSSIDIHLRGGGQLEAADSKDRTEMVVMRDWLLRDVLTTDYFGGE